MKVNIDAAQHGRLYHFVRNVKCVLRSRYFSIQILKRYCSATRLNISWIAVVLQTKHTAIFNPFGGMSQMPHFMLFGIHSMKYLGRVARERA